jgi:hypothetical protein
VVAMTFEEILEMTRFAGVNGNGTEVAALVEEAGGWETVIAMWRSMGGYAGQFADVWELSMFLMVEDELFAHRMGVSIELVHGFAATIQAWAVSDHLHEAQDALAKLCATLGTAYQQLAELHDNDAEALELAAWWNSSSEAFAARVPKVVPIFSAEA